MFENTSADDEIENSEDLSKLKNSQITFTNKTDITKKNNVNFNNTYSVINDNDNISSNKNKTHIVDNSLNSTLVFAPLAESTFTDKLATNYISNTNDNKSNNDNEPSNSVTSEYDMDDSFHLSDCSVSDENEDIENENDENVTNNINETMRSTKLLNLTSSLCASRKSIIYVMTKICMLKHLRILN